MSENVIDTDDADTNNRVSGLICHIMVPRVKGAESVAYGIVECPAYAFYLPDWGGVVVVSMGFGDWRFGPCPGRWYVVAPVLMGIWIRASCMRLGVWGGIVRKWDVS